MFSFVMTHAHHDENANVPTGLSIEMITLWVIITNHHHTIP